ncbi:MAG TPA: hypothetical protein DEG96_05055 [Candidatus Atribacteria bacterium]|uniref:Inner-membrane translocator n=1 Tax=candidate division TA06 bacterium 34_109 TaxID=1635277 RepID=A0A101HZS1_UNCT6|nr:MAG: Inner-membrane translocator [candidate division TA06 bacterium 34_109]HBY57213.1 hypothetical protein [Candidatus Atribacteria bacterium]
MIIPLIDSVIYTMLAATTPVVLAALGVMFTNFSGMFNIALEGMMLVSAFFSVFVVDITSNLWLGMIAGIGAATILGLSIFFICHYFHAEIFIVGMGANLIATGLTTFMAVQLKGSSSLIFENVPKLRRIAIPIIENIPILRGLSGHYVIDYLAIAISVICYILVFYTPYGYHLRTIGKDEWVAKTLGISITKHQFISYLWCGFLCGLGGAVLSLPVGVFLGGPVGMANGRGWLAIAVLCLGQENPLNILAAALFIGATSALSDLLQVTTSLSPRLLMALPFAAALIAIVFYMAKEHKTSLGIKI